MAEISALARPAPERFDGAAAWSTLTPGQQREIGTAALEVVATSYLMARVIEDALPELYERVAAVAGAELARELDAAVVDALPEDAFVASDGRAPRIPSLLGGVCRVCGCSQNDACPEGCGWAAEDLCTACVAGEHDHG